VGKGDRKQKLEMCRSLGKWAGKRNQQKPDLRKEFG
jgi:hypothetical protein